VQGELVHQKEVTAKALLVGVEHSVHHAFYSICVQPRSALLLCALFDQMHCSWKACFMILIPT
jgi:hypothetical protein